MGEGKDKREIEDLKGKIEGKLIMRRAGYGYDPYFMFDYYSTEGKGWIRVIVTIRPLVNAGQGIDVKVDRDITVNSSHSG